MWSSEFLVLKIDFVTAQGVYVFPCLTLLGYDNHEAPIQKLQKLGYKLADSNTRSEGREIKNISPFHLFRVMAKEFNYSPVKVVTTEAPGWELEIKYSVLIKTNWEIFKLKIWEFGHPFEMKKLVIMKLIKIKCFFSGLKATELAWCGPLGCRTTRKGRKRLELSVMWKERVSEDKGTHNHLN